MMKIHEIAPGTHNAGNVAMFYQISDTNISLIEVGRIDGAEIFRPGESGEAARPPAGAGVRRRPRRRPAARAASAGVRRAGLGTLS